MATDQHPEEIFYDKLNLIYIQIPNVEAILDDSHPLKNWIHCIRTLHTSEQPVSIETTPTTTKAITDAMTLAEFEALSPQQKFFYDCAQHAEAEAYSKEMTMKMDARAEGLAEGRAEGLAEGLAEGREKGREEGREEGRTEGEHQAKVMMAKSRLEQGVSIETISVATGFTADMIEQFKQELNR